MIGKQIQMFLLMLVMTPAVSDALSESFVVRLKKMDEVLEDQKRVIEQLQGVLQQTDVAFTVRLENRRTFPFEAVIQFEVVITNIGGGYVSNSSDPNYGKFIAPVNGTYLFTTTIGNAQGNAELAVNLRVNDEWQVNTRAPGDQDVGVCTVIVKLKQGDKVWVAHSTWSSLTDEFAHGGTSFSGHLIHADV